MCDECQGTRCGGKFAPFFCANVTCLQYYCEYCWASIHSRAGREFHKPLVKEGGDRPRHVPFRWSWAPGDPATSTGVDHKEEERALPQGSRCSGNLCIRSRFLKKKWVFLLLLLSFTVILLNSASSIMQNRRVCNGTHLHFDSQLVCLVPWFLTPDLSPPQYVDCHSHQRPSGWRLWLFVWCCGVVALIGFTGACTYFQRRRESPLGQDLPKVTRVSRGRCSKHFTISSQ